VKVAILHYAAPPVVGGVEQTIAFHARELARAGHQVRVLAGDGSPWDDRVEVRIQPEAATRHPAVLAVKRELDRGRVPSGFDDLRVRLRKWLAAELHGADALIAHNVFTLHKHLPLTAALHDWLLDADARGSCAVVLGWHHDLAWDMPGYRGELHPGYPWDLLRVPWPGVRHVTVSAAQRERLALLYGLAPEAIAVVPPGVDAGAFFRWTPATGELVRALRLLEAGPILLLPARLTPRKNVELALQILAALRETSAEDARLIVTGPPGPHNPANQAYLERLLAQRKQLGLEGVAHLLYEMGFTPDEATMADLYQLADFLLFPSTQEGFGIPLLEAGLARLPVFCSGIPPLRETGQGDVEYFPTDASPEAIAGRIWQRLCDPGGARLRYRVRREHLWETIVRRKVIPLLEGRL